MMHVLIFVILGAVESIVWCEEKSCGMWAKQRVKSTLESGALILGENVESLRIPGKKVKL